MIQVYTGNGKGKTTASLGLALRALGHDMKVCIIQFMKGSDDYGEIMMAGKLSNLTVKQFGRKEFVDRENPEPSDFEYASKGLSFAKDAIKNGLYNIVILDEINVAIDFKLVRLSDVLSLIGEKPADIELIVTGRNAPQELIDIADLVTEMKEIKHPYTSGIPSRKGIEY